MYIINNLVINIETSKRKHLKKVLALTKSMSGENLNETNIDNLYEVAQIALSKNKENKSFNAESIEDYLDLTALITFFEGYYNWVMENVNQKKLEIPYYPREKDGKENPYIIETVEEKTISKYLNIPLFEIDELDVVEFKFYLREAFIYNSSLTDEGIEYLRNDKRLETTDPERNKLRKKMNKD